MKVRVRLFAMLRERAGWRDRDLDLPDGARIAEAWAALVSAEPALAGFGEVVRFAANGAYAAPHEPLADGDELAIMPPVAGGAGEPRQLLRCELSAAPITDELLAELRRAVPTAADGALVLFVGQTRDTPGHPSPGEEEAAAAHAGDPVAALDYEAYSELAVETFAAIGREIEERFGVFRLAIIHRTGHVPLSEPSVVICAAAPHRAAAFDACRYAIEQLKARAPIWKREGYAGGGAAWIANPPALSPPEPTAGRDR